jgi:hypothetical protein
MTIPSVQALSNPSHELALDEIQSCVLLGHHEDVLVTPAGLLD